MGLENSSVQHYKIRRKSDGLYSSGGTHPQFNSSGKIWRKYSHVLLHLNVLVEEIKSRNKHDERWNCSRNKIPWPYNNCEIVMVEYVYSSKDVITKDLERYKSKIST